MQSLFLQSEWCMCTCVNCVCVCVCGMWGVWYVALLTLDTCSGEAIRVSPRTSCLVLPALPGRRGYFGPTPFCFSANEP